MAVMQDVTFVDRRGQPAFVGPTPTGCILHRTENPDFARSLASFRTVALYPHFLIGKSGEVAQIADTNARATHVGHANAFYLGIEVSSVASRWDHKQDPLTIRDSPMPAQSEALRRVVDWISVTHRIPKIGPPSLREMRDANGHWHGFCNHADVSLVIPSPGDHEEGLEDQEYLSLGIQPSTTRQGPSSMSALLPKLERAAMTPAQRVKNDALDQFLARLGR